MKVCCCQIFESDLLKIVFFFFNFKTNVMFLYTQIEIRIRSEQQNLYIILSNDPI